MSSLQWEMAAKELTPRRSAAGTSRIRWRLGYNRRRGTGESVLQRPSNRSKVLPSKERRLLMGQDVDAIRSDG